MALEPTEHIDVAYESNVAVLTFNRPDVLNAIAPETSQQLQGLLSKVDDDSDTSVVVLTGAGRAFCAGGDVKTMGERNEPGRIPDRVRPRGRHLVDTFLGVEKPLIAMVNGPAVGLGATIALLCDIVVMAQEAKIGDRHVNVGLVAGDGGAVVWPLLLGPHLAKEFLMTGRLLTGTEAAELRLVNRAVPLADLREETLKLAHEVAALPPYAVRGTKASVNRYVRWMSETVLDASITWEKISAMSLDHQEALRAFKERRAGNYIGR